MHGGATLIVPSIVCTVPAHSYIPGRWYIPTRYSRSTSQAPLIYLYIYIAAVRWSWMLDAHHNWYDDV